MYVCVGVHVTLLFFFFLYLTYSFEGRGKWRRSGRSQRARDQVSSAGVQEEAAKERQDGQQGPARKALGSADQAGIPAAAKEGDHSRASDGSENGEEDCRHGGEHITAQEPPRDTQGESDELRTCSLYMCSARSRIFSTSSLGTYMYYFQRLVCLHVLGVY